MAGTGAHYYRTADGTGLPHDPFNAIVGPRPIGWISTQDAHGVRNLAPYSFFNGFNYHPPIVGFASIGWKDSVSNIDATGELVWNLATRELAAAMNETSATLPSDQDEFTRSGLTPVSSTLVASPRVLESPVNFECRLTQLVQLQDTEGDAVETWLVLGQVVAVHIDQQWLVDGIYDTPGPRPILRAGGPAAYSEIGPDSVFTMIRPG
ncbi:flavin reductase family protein [Mycobacterium sp. CPCC 205372]|uniref:Flavin reductase family protein n=1 Tax=Mycobacterium hippophais TaxID=3016340 RepID=A0ABT4PUJ0_9MYCO|nr:flavin reductase family protein [Mycobacterium hippophais]MCZ8380154.1 flavin reductase family protein [Mycobacterium hippophais]